MGRFESFIRKMLHFFAHFFLQMLGFIFLSVQDLVKTPTVTVALTAQIIIFNDLLQLKYTMHFQ